MAAKGFIKLYRNIEDDPLWTGKEPFDKRSAWIDLMLMVNHADKTIIIGNHSLTVKRGQKFTSVRKLSERWHWGRNRTLCYLKLLEVEGKVYRDKLLNGTLLTIVEYDKTQSRQDTNEATIEATYEATTEATTRAQTRIYKNDKNEIKNTKEPAAPFEDF